MYVNNMKSLLYRGRAKTELLLIAEYKLKKRWKQLRQLCSLVRPTARISRYWLPSWLSPGPARHRAIFSSMASLCLLRSKRSRCPILRAVQIYTVYRSSAYQVEDTKRKNCRSSTQGQGHRGTWATSFISRHWRRLTLFHSPPSESLLTSRALNCLLRCWKAIKQCRPNINNKMTSVGKAGFKWIQKKRISLQKWAEKGPQSQALWVASLRTRHWCSKSPVSQVPPWGASPISILLQMIGKIWSCKSKRQMTSGRPSMKSTRMTEKIMK